MSVREFQKEIEERRKGAGAVVDRRTRTAINRSHRLANDVIPCVNAKGLEPDSIGSLQQAIPNGPTARLRSNENIAPIIVETHLFKIFPGGKGLTDTTIPGTDLEVILLHREGKFFTASPRRNGNSPRHRRAIDAGDHLRRTDIHIELLRADRDRSLSAWKFACSSHLSILRNRPPVAAALSPLSLSASTVQSCGEFESRPQCHRCGDISKFSAPQRQAAARLGGRLSLWS